MVKGSADVSIETPYKSSQMLKKRAGLNVFVSSVEDIIYKLIRFFMFRPIVSI